MSNSDLSVDPVLEPAVFVPTEPVFVPTEPAAVEPASVPDIPAPEPQPVDAAGQLIPTPEPTPEPEVHDATPAEIEASLTPPEPEEVVNPGLALAAPAYNPPADFEHTAYNPENVQHIS